MGDGGMGVTSPVAPADGITVPPPGWLLPLAQIVLWRSRKNCLRRLKMLSAIARFGLLSLGELTTA
jgi:hypothetical protein